VRELAPGPAVELHMSMVCRDGHSADSIRLSNDIVLKLSNSSRTTSPSIVISVDLDVSSSQT
jgi:hypothetical protein